MGDPTDWDEVWRQIDAARLTTADLLAELSDDEWAQPSLCDGWTVRDVAAHLTLQQIGPGQAFRELARTPRLLLSGGLQGLTRDLARVHAGKPTAELIAGIRAMIGSRKHNFGVSPLGTLTDILVHGQDIAIPLHRGLDMAPQAAAMAATFVWRIGYPFHARKNLHGFRLTATDTPWSVGEGAEVTGPMSALLLVLTGRLVALERLSGEGAAALTGQLHPHRN